MNDARTGNISLYCILLGFGLFANAQNDSMVTQIQPRDFWMMAGIGAGLMHPFEYTTDSSRGPSLGLCLSIQAQQNSLFSLRGIEMFTMFGSDGVGDISVLYGLYKKYSNCVLSLSAGLGLVLKNGGGIFDAIGIPLELQFFGRTCCFINGGIYCYANINTVRPFIGFLICPQFGKVKR